MLIQVLQKHWGGGIVGDDNEGRPVLLDPSGKRDIKGIIRNTSTIIQVNIFVLHN